MTLSVYSAGKVTTVVQSVGSTITGREACTLGVAVGVGLGEADPLGDAELVLELGDGVPFVELGDGVPFVELGDGVPFVELGDGVPFVELGDGVPFVELGDGVPFVELGDGVPFVELGDGVPFVELGDGVPFVELGDGVPFVELGDGVPFVELGDGVPFVELGDADEVASSVAEPLADALLEPVAEPLAESVGLALGSGGLGSSATKTSVRFSGVARARTANWPFWIPGRITIRSMVVGAVNLNVSSVPAPRVLLGAEAQKVRESSPTIDVAGLPYPVDDASTLATVAGVPRSGSSQ